MKEEPAKVVQLTPDKLGKIMIEIDCDIDKYNVGFSNPETGKLLNQIEMVNMFSPFHAACIINELKRRREGKLITPAKNIILQ